MESKAGEGHLHRALADESIEVRDPIPAAIPITTAGALPLPIYSSASGHLDRSASKLGCVLG
jgi:hypothetical protein